MPTYYFDNNYGFVEYGLKDYLNTYNEKIIQNIQSSIFSKMHFKYFFVLFKNKFSEII